MCRKILAHIDMGITRHILPLLNCNFQWASSTDGQWIRPIRLKLLWTKR